MSLILGVASLPWRGLRNTDKYGSGAFLASRDGGARPHLGRDYIAIVGDDAVSPLDGKIVHIGLAYPDSDLGSIRISGAGVEVRILYISPTVKVGDVVKRGQQIGDVQSLQERYPGITNHIHIEIWQPSNPELYIKAPA